MAKTVLFFVAVLIFAGCTTQVDENGGFEPKEAPQRTKYRTFISDEELKTQKELALIEANRSVELQKISSEARLKELELQKEKELALMRERERLLKIEHEQAMERYTLIGLFLLLILAGALLLWYLDRRRKDKLRAYEDNLKKYFHQKENEARVKIAEKILDTAARSNLTPEQRSRLIEALHSSAPKKEANEEEIDDNETQEAILIEDRKDRDDAKNRS
ncbi:MAG: hypothetical protein L3J42_05755 [Hydrogenimonas sp.]|nr:hypothetical protein [Hydrogenimonas sp.]